MPILEDPDAVLPTKKRRPAASQIITFLLYPVVFAVGLAVGFVVGVTQGENKATNQFLANEAKVNSTVIPNANTRVLTNTVNANANVSNVFNNTNGALSGGDWLQIDSATQSQLTQQEQQEKEREVDQTVSVEDIVRQGDLITIKYRLEAYQLVKQAYPTTSNQQIRLERGTDDVVYTALKDFYGGSVNQPIDPQSPDYYYGYSSDGQTFGLTAYLVSAQRVFKINNN